MRKQGKISRTLGIEISRSCTCPSSVRNNSTANIPAPSNELTALHAMSVASFVTFHDTLAGDLTM